MAEAPEWLQTLYDFAGGEIPYYAARLECKDCNKRFLFTVSDQNKEWVPPCFDCQSSNTTRAICQKLNSYSPVKEDQSGLTGIQ